MKILFHLGHPAHFHLFKNVIKSLKKNGYKVFILIKKKDILENLLVNSKIEYNNILPNGRKDNLVFILVGLIIQTIRLYIFCLRKNPKLLIGTSVSTPIISKFYPAKSININEDDAEVIPFYSKLSYPFSDIILTPINCSVSKWKKKKIGISSFHELAYLHPNYFKPDRKIVEKYFSINEEYYIIRFAKLNAHHDFGKRGITNNVAIQLIKKLNMYGKVFITSERKLNKELEKFRIKINPIDIHHLMAHASLYIGDSQTMAAEAGVLGVPFIRFNDFVGKISYLDELENKYNLGFGITTDNIEDLYHKVEELLRMPNRKDVFQERRRKMLSEKIDYAKFLIWFIENFPSSVKKMKDNPNFQNKFK